MKGLILVVVVHAAYSFQNSFHLISRTRSARFDNSISDGMIARAAVSETAVKEETLSNEKTSGKGGNPSMAWFMNSASKHTLLRADEEVLLARKIQAVIVWDGVRADLKLKLGREPTAEEWGKAVGLEPSILHRRYSQGQHAKRAMVASNLRLVVSIARQYKSPNLTFSDIVQEGTLGLLRAVEKFDPEKGFKFSTYATWWIKQAIMRGIADHSRTIRLPVHVHDMLNSINKNTRELSMRLGRDVTDEEVAARMEISVHRLRFIKDKARPAMSMDAALNDKGGGIGSAAGGGAGPNSASFGDTLYDKDEAPAHVTEIDLLKDDLDQLICTLSPREQDVIRMRFGLDSGKVKTLEEIGNIFCVTRERVRQIETRALLKLQQPYRNHKLRDYSISELSRKKVD